MATKNFDLNAMGLAPMTEQEMTDVTGGGIFAWVGAVVGAVAGFISGGVIGAITGAAAGYALGSLIDGDPNTTGGQNPDGSYFLKTQL